MTLHINRATIRALCAASMLCATTLPAFATTTLPPGPVEAFFTQPLTIAVGSTGTVGSIGTVPTGHRLVIQSISIYRSGAVAGSTSNAFLELPGAGGITGYLALPEITAAGSVYPSATLTTTAYLNASASIKFDLYRTGSTSTSETDSITVVGYYVAAQ